MTTQIRDTQFGRLVRVLSRRKIFRYLDEIDPSMHKSAAQQSAMSVAESKDPGPSQSPGSGSSSDHLEQSHDIHLVGWYGEIDPEVSRDTEEVY